MANITVKKEGERGCGFRKGGGIYLVSDSEGRSCGRMPIPLHVCPTCSQGIKPARGFTWIDAPALLRTAPECRHSVPCSAEATLALMALGVTKPPATTPGPECAGCPMSGDDLGRAALMWVGSKFYSPESFVREASAMGLSKRISQIPKELVVGKTWIWLAHRETFPAVHTPECAIERMESDYEFRAKMAADSAIGVVCDCGASPQAGVFHAFVPTRIEYVVKGDETEDELDALEKRGLSLVKIERIGENGELFPDPPKTDEEPHDGSN